MWNWREFYQLIEQIKKYTKVLYCGESLVQIQPFLIHTVSGVYRGNETKGSFCGYDASQVFAGRLVWLYLKKMPETGDVIFNTVFLRYGGKKHGIRMVYRKMAEDNVVKGKQNRGTEFFSMEMEFQKLIIIGRKETEIRKMTVAKLLNLFGRAVNEKGMLLLVEQNARILCQGIEEKDSNKGAVKTAP